MNAIKDAAYTSIGASAIAIEKLGQANAEAVERLNGRFDTARKDFDKQVSSTRKDVDTQIKLAKKTAVSNGKDLRAKLDPVAERFEARLPMQVAKALETGRTQTWDFYGVPAVKVAPKVAAKPAAKKAPARKTVARKTAARKTTARKTAAKK